MQNHQSYQCWETHELSQTLISVWLVAVPGRPDEVHQRELVQHLVAVVPGVQRSRARVVVQHGDVRVQVVEGDVGVLVGRRVRVEAEVDLRSSQV